MSCLVFTVQMYKNPISNFHVSVQSIDLSKGCGQQPSLLGGDNFTPADIRGISSIILTFCVFIRYSYLNMVDYLQSAFPHLQVMPIHLSQLAPYARYDAFSDEKSLENINSIVYLYLWLTDLIPSLQCGGELYCLPTALGQRLTRSQRTS